MAINVSGLASITPRVRLNSSSAALKRDAEKRLARYEHDDEVGGRLKMLPVGLVAETDDMVADLARVILQLAVADPFVLGFHRVEIRRRGHLGIDDNVLSAGQANDQVGCEANAVSSRRFLDVEVAVLEHARRFDDTAQLQLAPLSADIGRSERLHEPSGLHLQRLLCALHRAQLLGERRVGADAVLLDLMECAVDPRE
jgi:hypothetical protein